MAWYAKIVNGAVSEVTFFTDRYDSEIIYRELGGTWLKCCEAGSLRKHFPAVGYTYDRERDAFIPPKPFASWVLNDDTCLWNAPVAMPDDGKQYQWNEDTQAWVEVTA
jgi:hypothetical protein